jgi:hypothetical protein
MAYDPTALSLHAQLLGGKFRIWVYRSADPIGDVDATDYFALGYDAGMREGDKVIVCETDTDPPTFVECYVSAIDADGNATVSAMAYAGAGSFTTLTASGATTLAATSVTSLIADDGTATATAGAATLAKMAGKITSESLTTAQNAIYTLTITNSLVAATDIVFASVTDGTNTQGTPMIGLVTPGSNSIVIEVINKHATAEAFNGTVVVSFLVIKTS